MPHKPLRSDVEDADVVVITVNYRTPDLTMKCVASLRGERKALPNLRVVVVDSCSGDGSAEKLVKSINVAEYRDWVSFLPLSINGGFGWANNQALLTLTKTPEFVHLLNPDAEALPGAVTALVSELRANPRCGAAGSQLVGRAGRPVGSAFRFPSIGRELLSGAQSEALGRLLGVKSSVIWSSESVEVDWVTGASVMFRLDALHEAGLFDDGFFLYFEEVELMHRLHDHGWTVRHVPASRVVHHEGSSTGIGEEGLARSLPAYWYNSRRRYFAVVDGAAVAFLASLALLVGRSFGNLKSMTRSGAPHARDLVRHGIWPTRQDRRRAVPRMGDRPGTIPFWMRAQ